MNGVISSISTYYFGYTKDKNICSFVKRGWVGLEDNSLFPLSVAIWV